MKNFDIEQLERKNMYRTPENFFAGLQENVLKQTIRKETKTEIKAPQAKIIPLRTNRVYAAAATLALLLGIGIFIKTNDSAPNAMPAIADKSTSQNTKTVNAPITEQQKPLLARKTTEPAANVNQDLIFGSNNNQNSKRREIVFEGRTEKHFARATTPIANAVRTTSVSKDEPMDQLLISFTSAELAEMSREAEMDVYLDLYN